MRVTIITSCYNSELTIRDTLTSVAYQDYNDIEHIIIDGGSGDATLNIVSEFPHISKIISEKDAGIYDALNKGINLATGDIVGILNSDDFFADESAVNRIVKAFQGSNAEIIFANIDFVDDKNNNTILRHYSSRLFRPWMFKFGFQPAHPTFYTQLENFRKYGLYRTDLKIAGDFELLLRFIKVNKLPYKYINDSWVKMRIGGISTSGFKSVFLANSEILISCKSNGIYSNKILVYLKYLVKWWGFLFKKSL